MALDTNTPDFSRPRELVLRRNWFLIYKGCCPNEFLGDRTRELSVMKCCEKVGDKPLGLMSQNIKT